MSAVAALNNTLIPDPIDMTQQQFVVDGLITLSGNYGVANGHGDILALGGLCPAGLVPIMVEIFEVPTAGNAATGYSFVYAQGADINTGKLIVLQNAGAGNPNSEITQGNAYPAALTAATANIRFRAYFSKFV